VDYVIVAAIGALVGVGELVARYRDAPVRALRNWSAGLYIALNAVAALAALFLFIKFDWKLGLKPGPKLTATRVIIAGFGAMAFLRSAIFIVRVGYVCPEQIQGAPIDQRADVYSLGCVLCEALTGAVPYPRNTPALMLMAHISDDPPGGCPNASPACPGTSTPSSAPPWPRTPMSASPRRRR
jgi:serine/threonine protein kinase